MDFTNKYPSTKSIWAKCNQCIIGPMNGFFCSANCFYCFDSTHPKEYEKNKKLDIHHKIYIQLKGNPQ